MKERIDDYKTRKEHLQTLTDKELKEYFYELIHKLVEPLVEIGYKNTSKSIERSVLLRMGFSSLQAKDIVDVLNEHNLLSKGAGNCVYLVHRNLGLSIKEAGTLITQRKAIDFLQEVFKHNE